MGSKNGAKAGQSDLRPLADLASDIEKIIGVLLDEALLRHALTHRSFAYENGGVPNNERLEFLGDSVLGLVVTESLYGDHPEMAEGQLAKLRAAVVNMRALAEVARTLHVGSYLLLGRGEEATGGRDKASILADTMEALIGTIYLAEGLDKARMFVHHLIDPLLASSTRLGAGLDWKTSLQELAASGGHGMPEYRVTEEGPDHEKVFTAHAVVGDEDLGTGVGRSKKEAEQQAAHTAWTELTRRADAVLNAEVTPQETTTDDTTGQVLSEPDGSKPAESGQCDSAKVPGATDVAGA
ncbi:ribonuclease III [Mobilicoccus pelagius]|uniref:Ribonuclease 3 n=1 Tax=Mobilicoccus pelagius NBRC 104925 TaxID=1089455 RepID=H5UNE6_9MICO|nr:ribonuclease III [Mobilicoccus pelagius]GAB47254.1 ribonuclease III [Mobilicoccus pelagius NBRC 104925]